MTVVAEGLPKDCNFVVYADNLWIGGMRAVGLDLFYHCVEGVRMVSQVANAQQA